MTFAADAPTADTGPGFASFVAFFLLALALWFLMRNMNARMRRMSYRQQQAGRGKDDPQADGSVADRDATDTDSAPDAGGSSSDGGGDGGGGGD
ncbi:hypothetical protein [Oryzobacter telluris]|jgi:hypothetical protein|uniref:hypothetical protein n=1 Tax=Oryzobacter telluris TaxID=3149179 RepID=UPI00370D8865